MKVICREGLVLETEFLQMTQEPEIGIYTVFCGTGHCPYASECEFEEAGECAVCHEIKVFSANEYLRYDHVCDACLKKSEVEFQRMMENWPLRDAFEKVHGNALNSFV